MKSPTLKNIIILGKFSDGKIRQVFCNKQQQVGTVSIIRSFEPDYTLKVLDKEVEGITWESDVDLSNKRTKITKSKKSII